MHTRVKRSTEHLFLSTYIDESQELGYDVLNPSGLKDTDLLNVIPELNYFVSV